MTPTQTLHSLLTRLGAVPGGLEEYQRGPDRPQWYYHDLLLHNEAALAILCNAARRECDRNGIQMNFRWASQDYRPRTAYLFIVEGGVDYVSALIAGLEWIIEQREATQ